MSDGPDQSRNDHRHTSKSRGKQVSIGKYNEMLAAYCEQQSAEYVSKQCRVHWRTAEKYIERGDPDRGLEPLRKRFGRIVRQAMRKSEQTLAEARAVHLRATQDLLTKYEAAIAELEPSELGANGLVQGLSKLIELREKMLSASVKVHPISLFVTLVEVVRLCGWKDQFMKAT